MVKDWIFVEKDLSFKLIRKRESYKWPVYDTLNRYQSQWSKVEAEVSRLESLKASKMKEFVFKKRSELEETGRHICFQNLILHWKLLLKLLNLEMLMLAVFLNKLRF